MPVVRAYPNGAAVSRGTGGAPPPRDLIRGQVVGWSSHAAARHVRWLMSVEADRLLASCDLWAYTLTVRDTPGDAAAFHRLRRAWLRRCERALRVDDSRASAVESAARPAGLPLWCWVMEWQGRGTPHLHGVLVTPRGMRADVARLVHVAWPEVASQWGALGRAQDVRLVTGSTGWFQYLAKHIGRGAGHRQRAALPPGWAASGRLWGHSGGWPVAEAVLDVDGPAYVHLRRLVHSWALADARSESVPEVRRRRVAYLLRRRQLSREVSRYVGVVEWVPPAVLARMLDWVVAQGCDVVDRSTGEVL